MQIVVGTIIDDPESNGEVSREDYDFEEEYEADKGGEYVVFKVGSWHFKDEQNGRKKYEMEHYVDVFDAELVKKCKELKKGSLVFVAGKRWENNWQEEGVRRTRSFILAEEVRFLEAGEVGASDIKKYIDKYLETGIKFGPQ